MSWDSDLVQHVLDEMSRAYTRYDATQPTHMDIPIGEWLDIMEYLVNEDQVEVWQLNDSTLAIRKLTQSQAVSTDTPTS